MGVVTHAGRPPPTGEYGWGDHSERGERPVLVVGDAPVLDQHLRSVVAAQEGGRGPTRADQDIRARSPPYQRRCCYEQPVGDWSRGRGRTARTATSQEPIVE